MADKLRNEVDIVLNGETYTMRASFGAIRNIEAQLGNLVPLIGKIASGDAGISQSAIIVFEGLRGFGDSALSLEQVGNAILKDGLKNVGGAVARFLTLALEGIPLEEPAKA